MFSRCVIRAATPEEMRSAGSSLAHSLYRENLTVLLSGELGAGKTTFAQGFAEGLGVPNRVQSPTYALEQHYERFTHIDLYRLDRSQAQEFLRHSDERAGIRLIEWAERIDPSVIGPHIFIRIEEDTKGRMLDVQFNDEPVPEDAEIETWIRDVRLPEHIRRHIDKVTLAAEQFANALTTTRPLAIRKEALRAAAKTHDLLRFVDFPTWNGDAQFQPSDEDRKVWGEIKKTYGTPHEKAACAFLMERGYTAVGTMVRTHRGIELDGRAAVQTTEQAILAYADKRVIFDEFATLEARFQDFVTRYGKGKESEHHRVWLAEMKRMEAMLFPNGVPELQAE